MGDGCLLLLGEEGLLLCLQMRRHRDGCQRRTRTPWPHLNGTHPWVVDTGLRATTGGRLLGARGRVVASSVVIATRAPFPPPRRLLRRLPLEDLGPPAPPEPVLDVGEAALEEPAAAVEAARAVAGDSLFSNVSSSRMRLSRASRKVGKGRLRRRAGCDVGGPRRG